MATITCFEDLEVWKLARILNQDVYALIVNTNLKNDYKLKEQINGSCGSIMDNIAEGFDRDGNKEFIQFLSIAKASNGETRSQLYRILDRNYINEELFNVLCEKNIVLGKKITSLMTYLKNSDLKGNKYK